MEDSAKKEAREWIEKVTGETFHKDKTFGEELRSGVLLIKLLMKICPEYIDERKVHLTALPDGQPYKCMENISVFLKIARKIGCPETDLFPTVALFEQKDITKVVIAVHSVGRYAQKNIPSFTGPHLGAKVATPNKRMFTRDQQDDAYRAVSLMNMGSVMTMDRGMTGMHSSRVGIVDNRPNPNFGVNNTEVQARSVVQPRIAQTTQKHFEETKDPNVTMYEEADENNKVPVTVRGSKWGAPASSKEDRRMISYASKDSNGEHVFNKEQEVTAKQRKPSHRHSGHRHRSNRSGSSQHKKRGSKHSRVKEELAPHTGTFPASIAPQQRASAMTQSSTYNPELENFVFARLRDIDVGVIAEAGELLESLCYDVLNYKYGLGWKAGETVVKNIMKLGGGVGVVREKPENVTVGVVVWKPEGAVPMSGCCSGAFDWTNIRKQEYRGAIRAIHERNEEFVSGSWEVMCCGVVPDYQRRGIGRLLITHVAGLAEKQELPCIMDVSDEGSKAWAMKSGFKNLGRVNVRGHNYGSYLLLHKVAN